MNRIQEWLQRFMEGRYGVDAFSKTLNYAVLIFLVLALFTGNGMLELIGLGLLIYTYFRIFSRNIQARRRENERYLQESANLKYRWKELINRITKKGGQTDHFRIYICPNKSCNQKIRVPKGKGKIEITCPKCKTQFRKRS